MGLMSAIHRLLLRKGRLSDFLPDENDLASGDMPEEREAVRAEIEVRAAEQRELEIEISAAVRRLRDLNKKNHYGESLRRAFGGR